MIFEERKDRWKSRITVTFLLAVAVLPAAKSLKIILMYASCDNQLTYVLHLLHRSIRLHVEISEEDQTHNFNDELFHDRHNLSDACMWVIQETVAVVAITNGLQKWEGIDTSAHHYNLPHFVSSNLCHCQSYRPLIHSQYMPLLEKAVFQFLKKDVIHNVIILHEDEYEAGIILSTLLDSHNIHVSHLKITERSDPMKTMDHFFQAWNFVDLSDEGRFLISLGGGKLVDNLLKNLVDSNMDNKRTRLLLLDNPELWQKRLKNVLAYEVNIVVVSPDPLSLTECPVAIELLPKGFYNHKAEGPCMNLSSENKETGEAILRDFQRGFAHDCCPHSSEASFTFWQSWPSENGSQHLKPEAVWSSTLGLLRMIPVDLQSITVRIVVLPYQPYVLINDTGTDVTLKDCVFKHIIHFLSQRLNFKFQLLLVSGGQWGNKLRSGQWDGAIGMVHRGEADIIPYLASTPTRQKAMDYSKPLTYVKYGILVAFPTEPVRAFIFLRPYKGEVWFLFVLTIFAVSFILHKIHKWSSCVCELDKKYVRGLSSFFRCFWLIFGAMLNQGGTRLPVTNSARLVLASWWLAVLVIMATYSANLIAFLAFPEAKWVVNSIESVVEHNTIQMAIKDNCPVLEDFQESNIDVYRSIREEFLENPFRGRIIHEIDDDVVDEIAEGKLVFIDDFNFLNRLVEKDYQAMGRCRLTVAPNYFSMMNLALGFRRGSSLLPLVNKELQQMQESGVLEHWKERFSPRRAECFSFVHKFHGQAKINLEDLQGPFYLLAIGLVFGMVFLSSEYTLGKVRTAYKRHVKKIFYRRQCAVMYW